VADDQSFSGNADARGERSRGQPKRDVFADGGYSGAKLQTALNKIGRWTIEIVKRCDAAEGFVVLPRRWVVERTFAWPNRNRRLAKDFEATLESALAWMVLASIKLLARRLARLIHAKLSRTLSRGFPNGFLASMRVIKREVIHKTGDLINNKFTFYPLSP
jgi:transposase